MTLTARLRRLLAEHGIETACCVSIGLVLGGAMLMVCVWEVSMRIINL